VIAKCWLRGRCRRSPTRVASEHVRLPSDRRRDRRDVTGPATPLPKRDARPWTCASPRSSASPLRNRIGAGTSSNLPHVSRTLYEGDRPASRQAVWQGGRM
jgi:hypothetical protein